MAATKIPWIEKYRPTTIDELVIKDSIRSKIKTMLENHEIPDLIISGPPGTGKTSTVQCIVRILLGRYIKIGVLDLNASDDRGIKTVHESIQHFCATKDTVSPADIGIFMKHKIVVLDEVDNMTDKAQQLISKLMQDYGNKIKFIFTCNKSDGIIEGIQSRCSILKFDSIEPALVVKRLEVICKRENIEYTVDGLESICNLSNGDLRCSINYLQLVHSAFNKIESNAVYIVCDVPHPDKLEDIMVDCSERRVDAIKKMGDILDRGYSHSDISRGVIRALRLTNKLDEKTKIMYMECVSKTAINISKGLCSNIQIIGCIAQLCLIGKSDISAK